MLIKNLDSLNIKNYKNITKNITKKESKSEKQLDVFSSNNYTELKTYNRINIANNEEIKLQKLIDSLPKGKNYKIFIVHSSHTGGHKSAAKSIEAVLSKYKNIDVKVINTMKDTPGIIQNTQKGLFHLVTDIFPKLRKLGFSLAMKGNPIAYWIANNVLKIKAFFSKKFLNKIKTEKPDIIISTHSQTNSILSYWKEKGKINMPVYSVVTDFSAHRIWAQPDIDKYFVATDRVKKDLEKFGIDKNKIEVTGIPIKPEFATISEKQQKDIKTKLGLELDKPTILLSGGSMGYGNFTDIVNLIDKNKINAQVVVITGKNEQKRKELQELADKIKTPLIVKGYVNNMYEWIKASDIIISKPGGLTTSEVLSQGKPIVLMQANEGLEGNLVDAIKQTGAALVAKDKNSLINILDNLIKDDKLYKSLSQKAKYIGKPYSSFKVAQEIIKGIK